MSLSNVETQFITQWGEIGPHWGFSRSVSQILALVFISDEPCDAEAIKDKLGIARSNVSICLKELQALGLVSSTRPIGTRRDVFKCSQNPAKLAKKILAIQRQREIEPLIDLLEDVSSKNQKSISDTQKEKLEGLLSLATFYDARLSVWESMGSKKLAKLATDPENSDKPKKTAKK